MTTCYFGFHKWSKWGNEKVMTVTIYPYGLVSAGAGPTKPAIQQERRCEKCNKLQLKLIENK